MNFTTPELAYTEIGGMKVATIANLVKMKVAAARPIDLEHLQDLVEAGYTTKAKVMELARGMQHTDEQKTVLSLLKEKSQDSDDLPPASP